jgi:hypothetical protein
MHEDSPLRKCSTTTCCSKYTYVYQPSGGGAGGPPGPYDPYGYDGGQVS